MRFCCCSRFPVVCLALSAALLLLLYGCAERKPVTVPIDRFAVVSRHTVAIDSADTLGSLSVGNGHFAFTVDVSGLQTFPTEYENGIPLGTQAQWAWHSNPSPVQYTLKDVAQRFPSCDDTSAPYAIQHKDGTAAEASDWLRQNPHRLHLGLVGLVLLKEDGTEAALADLHNIHQRLDLWTGEITSTYTVDSLPVKVILYAHPSDDQIGVRIESPLILKERLRVRLRFPYGQDCHVCPGYDWTRPEAHTTDMISVTDRTAVLKRVMDSTTYFVRVDWNTHGILSAGTSPHHFELSPSKSSEVLEFTVLFSERTRSSASSYTDTRRYSISEWKAFWQSGAAIDFSECTDPRAKELERRVVLSQYLTRIQCAGSMPPQETGLTMNSWYGKFHLEMHWWHAAHFALWGRGELLERSLGWYDDISDEARHTAQWQGYAGARWPKMTDPYGHESPSSIGAFIAWQQPHPIYFAELIYRTRRDRPTLEKYKSLVFETADFMASFVRKGDDNRYHLCHPIIPAQEIFKPMDTEDPAFELQYWHYGISVAQEWRDRLGLRKNRQWQNIIDRLQPLSQDSGRYLPTRTAIFAYREDSNRRDHPSVLAAFGFLPYNHRIDTAVMARTFDDITACWHWESTWGWDYPLMAMTAARLNRPSQAVDALLMDEQKNTYLVNGHNYQDKRLRLYLPGNGGVLAAVAMMAAGWDGSAGKNPGFPRNGKWKVKWEGLYRMP